jgi:hypothetical protein
MPATTLRPLLLPRPARAARPAPLARDFGPRGRPLPDSAALRDYLATGFGEVQPWAARGVHAASLRVEWDGPAAQLRLRSGPHAVAHPVVLFDGVAWTRDVDRALVALRAGAGRAR